MGEGVRENSFFYELVKSYGVSKSTKSEVKSGVKPVSPEQISSEREKSVLSLSEEGIFRERGWDRVEEFVYRKTEVLSFKAIRESYPVLRGVGGKEGGFEHSSVTALTELLGLSFSNDGSLESLTGSGKGRTILFFDTETTGLSTGAGSLIFLFGSLRAVEGNDSFVFEQIFLSDFPGELDFLNCIRPIVEEANLIVSFNGKGFDTHLLRSRFILNGMEIVFPPQVDLLYISRRLWRNLIGGCSLRDIEEKILGYERVGDIPGAEIPGVYFDYLRKREYSLVKEIFRHNKVDVISMVVLLFLVTNLFQLGVPGRLSDYALNVPVDTVSLGSFLLERGREKEAVTLLSDVFFNEGNLLAGKLLSLHYKRVGLWRRAKAIWERMLEKRSLFAAIELAKYYEHREHLYSRALSMVEDVLSWGLPFEENVKREILHRKRRLIGRLNNGSGKRVV